MFDTLTSLFDFDLSSWISEVVGLFTTTNQIGEDLYETTISEVPWSALIPWPQIFAFVVLIVFTCLIFKFLRSVICRIL